MKLYIISGLGADFSVFENITFPRSVEPIFIPWLMPEGNECLENYIWRMSQKINPKEPFALLGYSFGGIIVQEIHRKMPAKKVIILSSVKSHEEMPFIGKFFNKFSIIPLLPISNFEKNAMFAKLFIGRFIESDASLVNKYFVIQNPEYIKWSLDKIVHWKSEKNPEVIQISGDQDLAFPIKYLQPDYCIHGATHMLPATHGKEVSSILREILP